MLPKGPEVFLGHQTWLLLERQAGRLEKAHVPKRPSKAWAFILLHIWGIYELTVCSYYQNVIYIYICSKKQAIPPLCLSVHNLWWAPPFPAAPSQRSPCTSRAAAPPVQGGMLRWRERSGQWGRHSTWGPALSGYGRAAAPGRAWLYPVWEHGMLARRQTGSYEEHFLIQLYDTKIAYFYYPK